MADKEIDKKSEQGVSGFLKRNFGTGTEQSYGEIYRDERERAECRSGMGTGERLALGTLFGLAGALAALGGSAALEELVISPDNGVDASFTAQLEPQSPNQYIGVNYGNGTYALSLDDNGKPLIWQLNHHDELVLQETTGDALEDVTRAVEGLERSIGLIGSGQFDPDSLANIVSFQNVSDMHIEEDNIERQTEGVQGFSPNDQLNYVQTLEKVLPTWQDAQQTIAYDFYGFTNDQRTQIKGHDYNPENFVIGATTLGFALTLFGFAGAPAISAGSRTLGRARRGRKNAREMKKG